MPWSNLHTLVKIYMLQDTFYKILQEFYKIFHAGKFVCNLEILVKFSMQHTKFSMQHTKFSMQINLYATWKFL